MTQMVIFWLGNFYLEKYDVSDVITVLDEKNTLKWLAGKGV
jgi:hypothetical protein